MKEVPLTNSDKVAFVDDEDFEKVRKYKWRVQVPANGRTIYARGYIPKPIGKDVSLHRLILNNPPSSQFVDHKNRNGLDCRRANLRLCTAAQNTRNATKYSTNTSGYKGVTHHRKKKWNAYICIGNGKVKVTYGHATAEEAARSYDDMARQYHGEFACPNFPEEG